MSIFPKRAAPGQAVTIHWNFNTAHLATAHIYPRVRIGVRDPAGRLTLLLDDHVLALPNPAPAGAAAPAPPAPVHLRKNVPLLVLASYLGGPQRRQVLADILHQMQAGRHFYFVYHLPPDAPLGRYTLLSEVHGEGQVRYSKTADEDFFWVERVDVLDVAPTTGGAALATVRNPGPEPVPVKVVEYQPPSDRAPAAVHVRVLELPTGIPTELILTSGAAFLLYNEERITLTLRPDRAASTYLRNQQLLALDPPDAAEPTTCVLAPDEDAGYELTGPSCALWQRADGLCTRAVLLAGLGPDAEPALQEMLDAGLLQELPRPSGRVG